MKTKAPTPRRWADALRKVEREGHCRVCGSTEGLEAAHVIARRCDPIMVGPKGGEYRYVHPDSIVPLCRDFFGVGCHQSYDNRELDLLPYLRIHEQSRAVEDAGGIISALVRICAGRGEF